LFWTEIVTAGNVQVIIPNGSVWGQPLKNLSTYDAPVATTELRIPVAEEGAVSALRDKLEAIVSESPVVEKSPAPSVLLDRAAADNGLQVVVTFAPHGDAAVARSELIQAMAEPGAGRANPA
jgi:small conductance mechanosensitive channel